MSHSYNVNWVVEDLQGDGSTMRASEDLQGDGSIMRASGPELASKPSLHIPQGDVKMAGIKVFSLLLELAFFFNIHSGSEMSPGKALCNLMI